MVLHSPQTSAGRSDRLVPQGLSRRLRMRGVGSCAVVLNNEWDAVWNRPPIALPAPIENCDESRQREFRAGRYCAERALESIGAAGPIGMDNEGLPVWPRGFVGSIAHCGPITWSAAARSTDLQALGVDSEPIPTVPHGDASVVAECQGVLSGALLDPAVLVALVTSAKRSAYKAISPLTHAMIGGRDLEIIHVHMQRGTFCVRLLRDASDEFRAGARLDGEFEYADHHVHTAVFVDG